MITKILNDRLKLEQVHNNKLEKYVNSQEFKDLPPFAKRMCYETFIGAQDRLNYVTELIERNKNDELSNAQKSFLSSGCFSKGTLEKC